MNRKDQIKLINECVDWFEHRYPQLIGALKPVPIGETKIKRPFWPWRNGFRIHTSQIRLVFTYHQRVWIFEPYDDHEFMINQTYDDVRSERLVVMNQAGHNKRFNNSDDFAHEIIDILVYYQIDHP